MEFWTQDVLADEINATNKNMVARRVAEGALIPDGYLVGRTRRRPIFLATAETVAKAKRACRYKHPGQTARAR